MDFVERWFGVSPDGGNGSLEAVAFLLVLVIVSAAVFRSELPGWCAAVARCRYIKHVVLPRARLIPLRSLLSAQYVSDRAHNRTYDT